MQWLAVYGPDWIERTRKMWRDRESYNFGLFDAASREIAGSVWLSQIRWLHGCANLGYWVRTSMAGRGLATAGVRFIARFGFEDLRLHRLEILVATDNRASMRVARKAGAVREGILRERLRLEGQYHDAVLFSLLPCDTRRQR
jgi:RimJ/RimL family protein N-acetyltransferase